MTDSLLPGYTLVTIEDHEAALKAKDEEIEQLRQAVGLASTLNPTMEINTNDPIAMMRQVHAHVTEQYNTLLATAVQFAEALGRSDNDLSVYIDTQDFLASPEVKAWRKKGKP